MLIKNKLRRRRYEKKNVDTEVIRNVINEYLILRDKKERTKDENAQLDEYFVFMRNHTVYDSLVFLTE